MRQVIIIFCIVFILPHAHGQTTPKEKASVYKVNRRVEIPITAGLLTTYLLGLDQIQNKPGLDSAEIQALDPNDVWKFDRRAIYQDPAYREQANNISDAVMKATVVMPLLLMFDGKMRKDWLDLLILYGESHAVSGNTYVLATSFYDRNRPYVYSSEIPDDHKMGGGTRNSFFSGHTSTTAVSSFFMAKVLSDYHPELGNKKFLLFAAALIPPSIVGLYRYKAMKHFPTDVLFGMAIGTASGILVPHFHKIKKKTGNFSFLPYAGQVSGMRITFSIR